MIHEPTPNSPNADFRALSCEFVDRSLVLRHPRELARLQCGQLDSPARKKKMELFLPLASNAIGMRNRS